MPWRFLLATAVISLLALYIGHSVSLRTIVAVVAGGGWRSNSLLFRKMTKLCCRNLSA